MTINDQPVTQMRAKESGCAGDKNSHVFLYKEFIFDNRIGRILILMVLRLTSKYLFPD
jgi:hypothetical protein